MFEAMEELGIEQARIRLGDIVDRARFTGDPTAITRNGRPAAVVVAVEWYEQAQAIIAKATEGQS